MRICIYVTPERMKIFDSLTNVDFMHVGRSAMLAQAAKNYVRKTGNTMLDINVDLAQDEIENYKPEDFIGWQNKLLILNNITKHEAKRRLNVHS